MAFTQIDHIGVAVPDLRTAITIYCSIGGLELVTVEENADQRVAEAMLAGTAPGPWLQLVAPLDEESPVAKFLADHRPGLHHLAYAVDDLAAEATRLAQQGVDLLYDEPRPGTAGTRVNFIHPRQSGGTLLELVEGSQVRKEPTEGSRSST